MPSSKCQRHETPKDTRRTSMRRLSSIASLQQLLSFKRRRSNNTTDDTIASCSSNVSLPSPTANKGEYNRPSTVVSSRIATDEGAVNSPQAATVRSPRTGKSYVCLPDDPIGAMPRSRTFSDLPIPSRFQKHTNTRLPSDTHESQPSSSDTSTRLPTPPASTRKYASDNMYSTLSRGSHTTTRMTRSDTEPLLSVNPDHTSQLPRPTAFKENISVSPLRLAQARFNRTYPKQPSLFTPQQRTTSLPRHASFTRTLPTSSSTSHAAIQNSRDSVLSLNHSLNGLQSAGIQRWDSQPLLTDTHNSRPSRRYEVRETRLMSALQAPTPPPPSRTLINEEALAASRLNVTKTYGQLRQVPGLSSSTNCPSSALSSLHRGDVVTSPEPPAYWSGRLSSLVDSYRNKELEVHFSDPLTAKAKAEGDKLHTPTANVARLRRALEHLHSLCLTDAASESLRVFQMQFATSQRMPELSRPIQLSKPVPIAKVVHGEVVSTPVDSSEPMGSIPVGRTVGLRKLSFVDKLLGRSKRHSLV